MGPHGPGPPLGPMSPPGCSASPARPPGSRKKTGGPRGPGGGPNFLFLLLVLLFVIILHKKISKIVRKNEDCTAKQYCSSIKQQNCRKYSVEKSASKLQEK